MPFLCNNCHRFILNVTPSFHNIFCIARPYNTSRRNYLNNHDYRNRNHNNNNINNDNYNNRNNNNNRNYNNFRRNNNYINNRHNNRSYFTWRNNSNSRDRYHHRNYNNNSRHYRNFHNNNNRIERRHQNRIHNITYHHINDNNEIFRDTERIMENTLNDILERSGQIRPNSDDDNDVNNNNSANNDNNGENNEPEEDFNDNYLYEEDDDGDFVEENHGVSEEVLFRLPRSIIPDVSKLEEKQCIICLGDYNNGDELTTLPCFHLFHPKCINTWLLSKNICPVCKFEIKFNNNNF